MKTLEIKLGEEVREGYTKKQRLLLKLFCIPVLGKYFTLQIRKSYGINKTVDIQPGFHCETAFLKVGNYCSLTDLFIHGSGEVEIGEHCSISRGCKIITGSHDFSNFNVAILKPTVIRDYVWVSRDATIMQGVIIGRGAVIGAKSVVRNNIPPYAIVIGNPCKVIGFRYNPDEASEFEKNHYPEDERTDIDLLKSNYHKYFVSRIKEIKQFCKI